jgi:DNA mismatch endonuclease (patch repair protein)
MRKSKTKIEGLMGHALKSIGIKFVTQYYVGKAVPDVAIPSDRIAIFCDGDYFHGLPETKAKDARVNTRLRQIGWRVFRFSEHDILKNPHACADKVRRVCEL